MFYDNSKPEKGPTFEWLQNRYLGLNDFLVDVQYIIAGDAVREWVLTGDIEEKTIVDLFIMSLYPDSSHVLKEINQSRYWKIEDSCTITFDSRENYSGFLLKNITGRFLKVCLDCRYVEIVTEIKNSLFTADHLFIGSNNEDIVTELTPGAVYDCKNKKLRIGPAYIQQKELEQLSFKWNYFLSKAEKKLLEEGWKWASKKNEKIFHKATQKRNIKNLDNLFLEDIEVNKKKQHLSSFSNYLKAQTDGILTEAPKIEDSIASLPTPKLRGYFKVQKKTLEDDIPNTFVEADAPILQDNFEKASTLLHATTTPRAHVFTDEVNFVMEKKSDAAKEQKLKKLKSTYISSSTTPWAYTVFDEHDPQFPGITEETLRVEEFEKKVAELWNHSKMKVENKYKKNIKTTKKESIDESE